MFMMKICGWRMVILFLFALLAGISTFAGGVDSSGGGIDRKKPEEGSAWFVGSPEKRIRTCVEYSAAFGLEKTQATRLLQSAFRAWSSYIETKKLKTWVSQDDRRKIITEADLMGRCDGSEDLTLYLGVSNPAIEDVRKSYQDPLAFAHRISYDRQRAWGKGFIWVAAQNSADVLQGILLHEVGHVLGCGHVPGTIMKADLGDFAYFKDQLAKIDWSRELVQGKAGMEEAFPASMGYTAFYSKIAFQQLAQQPPRGEVSARLIARDTVEKGFQGTLVLSDASGKEHAFQIESKPFSVTGAALGEDCFRLSAQERNVAQSSHGDLRLGLLRSASGMEFPVTIARNLASFAVEIRLFEPKRISEHDSFFFVFQGDAPGYREQGVR